MGKFNYNDQGIHVFFEAKWKYDEQIDKLKEIQDVLSTHGCYIVFEEDGTLSISVYKSGLSRGAGRKKKLHAVKDSNSRSGIRLTTLGDVQKMQETMTEDEIVSYLNMSRATYYRHLKKAKEQKESNPDHDPTF